MNDRSQQSLSVLKKFDLKEEDFKNVETIEQLVKKPPLMVLADSVQHSELNINGFKIPMKKGASLAMPLGIFLDAKRGKNRQLFLKPSKLKFVDLFKRYRGQNLDNKTLLVMRNGGFGDLIFIQPVLKMLKEKYPTCKIIFASSPRFIPIFWDFPEGLIDSYLMIPFASKFLKETDYHLTFEGAIERCGEAHHENCYDLMSRIAGLDIDHTDDKYRPVLIPKKEIMDNLEKELPDEYFVIQMRASNPIRMMSQEKWAKLMKGIVSLGKKIVLIDVSQFDPFYNNFIEKSGIPKDSIFNLSRFSKSINFATGVISKSLGVIGIDSSFLHMGAALNKPVLGIYGAFKGDLRLRYYKNADWVETGEKVCNLQPCFFHQSQTLNCPFVKVRKEPICLESINDDVIFEKVKSMIRG